MVTSEDILEQLLSLPVETRARLAQQALLLQQQQQALNPFFRTAVQPTTQRAIR